MDNEQIVEDGHSLWRIVDPNGQVRAGFERVHKSGRFTQVISMILQNLLNNDSDSAVFLPVNVNNRPRNVRSRRLTIVDAGVEGSFRFRHRGTTYHLVYEELERGSNRNRNIPADVPPTIGRFEPVW